MALTGRSLAGEEGALDVHVHHLAPLVRAHLRQELLGNDTGIVDHDVRPHAGECPLDRRLAPEVYGDGIAGAAARGDLAGQNAQPLGVAGECHDAVRPGKTERNGAADAARRPRDDSNRTVGHVRQPQCG